MEPQQPNGTSGLLEKEPKKKKKHEIRLHSESEQPKQKKLDNKGYEEELLKLQTELVKMQYWFSVSDEEQERRFQSRTIDPARRWKLSPMDLESRDRWVEYSKAKDKMLTHTNIPEAPWFTVEANDKKRARLNCLSHLLSKVPYTDMTPEPMELPPRRDAPQDYVRPPRNEQFFVPSVY